MRNSALLVIISTLVIAIPAQAEACDLNISADDMISYNKSELKVPANCTEVTVTLSHKGRMSVEQMGHNWVLAATSDWQAVSREGLQAGAENDYLPPNDKRIVAHTSLIGGGKTTSVTFDITELDTTGDYTFFCSFPGHSAIMKGSLVFTAGMGGQKNS